MAKKGRKVTFHGAFKHKSDAVKKERQASNRFIKPIKIRGERRFVVMSRRGRS